MAEHPVVAWLVAELARVEEIAREADVEADGLQPSNPVEFILAGQDMVTRETEAAERHVRTWMPASVLRRVAADRQILAEHANDSGDCTACGRPSEETNSRGYAFFAEVEWPCRTVLLLAEAYGWTEETQ